MKEKCGFDKTYLTYQLYCDKCKKLFFDDVDNCKTPGCEGSKTDSQCRKYFVTSDLRRLLKEIMEVKVCGMRYKRVRRRGKLVI